MTQPYVYRLEDKETGKFYIGCRFAKKCSPKDLGISYFTSSKIVTPLFKENPQRFNCFVIVTGDQDYVINVEKTMLDFHNAVISDKYYNRTSGRAIHPDDRLAGAYKEHAKRSPELYAKIVYNMRSKTTREHCVKGAKNAYEKMTPDERVAKMAMMRSNITDEGRAKSINAMQASLTFEIRSSVGKLGGKVGGPIGCKKTNVQLWRCLQCGMLSKPGPIGKHQSRSGHVGKERVE